jgi:dephospho-CoA kinase
VARTGSKPIDKPALVVGVAGIMGSGKSTVARVFEDQGAGRIDADLLGRKMLRDERIRDEIVEIFGRRVVKANGEIDTLKLGRAAFKNPESAKSLDRITRGALINRIRMKIRDLSGSRDVVVVDAALLPEWKPEEWIDILVVVDSDEESAVRRAAREARFTRANVRARMEHQLSRREKSREADVIIPNYGSLEDLKDRARKVYRTLLDSTRKE